MDAFVQDDFDPTYDSKLAIEKMVYGAFRREYTVFRLGDIPRKMIDRVDIRLPNNSVLHSLDNLLTPKEISIAMDTSDPMIQNEEYLVYVYHHTQIPGRDHALFPVTDRYRFVPGRFLPQIQKFYQSNKDVRRAAALDVVVGRQNVLTVINYNAVFEAYFQGRLQPLRRFDLALRTVLANIVDIEAVSPGKMHHVHIPLSGDVYSKVQLDRTFKELTLSTIRVWNDPSFFFLIHFFGYLTDSATTILSKMPQAILDRMHIVFTCGTKTVIYNLGDLKAMVGTNKNFYILVLRHINRLKLTGSEVVEDAADLSDEEVDTQVALQVDPLERGGASTTPIPEEEDETPETPNDEPPATAARPPLNMIPSATMFPKKESAKPVATETKAFHVQLQEDVAKAVDATDIPLSQAQRDKALRSPDHLKNVELGGRSVAELIGPAPDPDIRGREVAALNKTLTIDPSMLTSSVTHFDQIYVEHQLPRDIAAVLTSFSGSGMFLSDLREQDEVSEFNRIRTYTAIFTDVTGKRHTVRFKLPIIDRDGTILLNGIRSRMIKQQVNLPIVKVSDTRVNLASNYNKTLVERSTAQAHRFDVYLARYLGALATAGKVQLDYGHTVITDRKVAYDYACLADRFLGMRVGPYEFTFDYANRIPAAATEAYIEANSTMTNNGVTYNLATLMRSAATLPKVAMDLSRLVWILKESPLNEPDDQQRIQNADLTAPILVAELDGQWVVIDGMHRLAKAASLSLPSLPAKVIPPALLARHKLAPGEELLLLKDTSPAGREAILDSVYCGKRGGYAMYYGQDNVIRVIDVSATSIDTVVREAFTIQGFLSKHCATEDLPLPKAPVEWTELKLLDRSFPVAFVLGYQFGLSTLLQKLGHPYRFTPHGMRAPRDIDEISIAFADGNLVFPRYPLKTGLVLGGLSRFDMKHYVFAHLDLPDTYFTLLSENRLSTNYLKGIKDFFRFFVDPITRDVLLRMREPITPEGLLLRSTEMLSTKEHRNAASMQNHRMRGYERFADILYNELARELAHQDSQRVSKKRQFSLNPEKVLYAVAQDATIQPAEDINPIHDLKTKSQVTYSGQGGRSGRSMMVADRNFADDATGILSEATPDSGKVAINAYYSVDPVLDNIRGMYKEVDLQDLKPANILSTGALLIPGVTQDD